MSHDDHQQRRSIIGEIIGSFMAGVVVAAVIILLTGEFTIIELLDYR